MDTVRDVVKTPAARRGTAPRSGRPECSGEGGAALPLLNAPAARGHTRGRPKQRTRPGGHGSSNPEDPPAPQDGANDTPSAATIAAFSERLEAYASTLPQREQQALTVILLRSMDPIERMRWRDPRSLLDSQELAVLQKLQEERVE